MIRGYISCLLLAGVGLWAQMNTGAIAGSVQDPSGAVLAGAGILAQNAETGQRFTAVSNNAGEYLFPQLAAGTYSLTAGAADFKQAVVSKFEIHAGDRIAQMVIARYEAIEWEEGELKESRRGEGGFGSSGR